MMAAGSQILMICLCQGESVEDWLAGTKKGLRRGDVTLSDFLVLNFSGRDDGRDRREWRIPLFWRPVVPG